VRYDRVMMGICTQGCGGLEPSTQGPLLAMSERRVGWLLRDEHREEATPKSVDTVGRPGLRLCASDLSACYG
jgi:hypothetical protein